MVNLLKLLYCCLSHGTSIITQGLLLTPDHLGVDPDSVHVLDLLLQRGRDYPVLLDRVQTLEFSIFYVHLEHGSTSAGHILHLDLLSLQKCMVERGSDTVSVGLSISEEGVLDLGG